MSIQRRMMMAVAVMAMGTIGVSAQEPAVAPPPPAALPPSPPARPGPRVPLEVRVVVIKSQGEKRISIVPYVLAVNAVGGTNRAEAERAQLTIGSDVPVPTQMFSTAVDKMIPSYNYKNVGTTISAGAMQAEEGRFDIDLSIDETSVGTSVTDGQGQAGTQMPVFKSFKARNRLLLRNGQTREFTAATDRVNGETVRIEVTLTVLK